MTAVLIPAEGEFWSPATLAQHMSTPDAPVTTRWVADHMADGSIPSVRVGRRRFFTHSCGVELAGRIDRRAAPASISGFDVRTRRSSAA